MSKAMQQPSSISKGGNLVIDASKTKMQVKTEKEIVDERATMDRLKSSGEKVRGEEEDQVRQPTMMMKKPKKKKGKEKEKYNVVDLAKIKSKKADIRHQMEVERKLREGTLPKGRLDVKPPEMSPLQKHAAYFDTNYDCKVSLYETYSGFRRLGFNVLMSLYAMTVIHLFLTWLTWDSWWRPSLSIKIRNIHRCKHGSDSQAYDHQGHFHRERFEEFWDQYDPLGKGYMTYWDLLCMTEKNRDAFDVFGYLTAKLEWTFLYLLAAEDGKLRKEDVLAHYDGSLFYRVEEKRKIKAMLALYRKELDSQSS